MVRFNRRKIVRIFGILGVIYLFYSSFISYLKHNNSNNNTETNKHRYFFESNSYYKSIQSNGLLGEGLKSSNYEKQHKEEIDKGWKKYEFNNYLSTLIPINRTVKDQRLDGCKTEKYSSTLPSVSVIMCFHNEAITVLLRSVYSVINQTPDYILKEILLVDDFSDFEDVLEPLDLYLKRTFNDRVRVLRNKKREGLIRSRLYGAREAKGEVLLFLDSHIEATIGWIEPLLDLIQKDDTNVVTPVIDIIDDDTFGYIYRNTDRFSIGIFDWNLRFTWQTQSENDYKKRTKNYEPIRSPTMAGGLFAISKRYFNYLGTYDDKMEIWGGENLELSFRIWMCGGHLLIVPCSHVGHVFRDKSPYVWKPGFDVIKHNNVRLAQVWLDEYKELYFERIDHNLVIIKQIL
jgi:polypeptide N-acetylgalactosaminyltransferase